MLHDVPRARSDWAGSARGRAAVEGELVRAPPMAVPVATVHAAAPQPRAPDAHDPKARCYRRGGRGVEIRVARTSKTFPPLAKGQRCSLIDQIEYNREGEEAGSRRDLFISFACDSHVTARA